MSNYKAAPVNPETEVTKATIATMANRSIFKVGFVTLRDKWGFPKSIRKGPRGITLYSRAAVSAWLQVNDLKTFVFTAEDRAPLFMHKKEQCHPGSAEYAKLHIGARPKKFAGHGISYRVHVPERHEYIPPDPRLARASNCADHRLIYFM
jgi:hypothetical protein